VRAYELQLDAMDHHDLLQPLPGDNRPAINRVKAATIVADVDTDQLFPTMQAETLVAQLRKSALQVERATIRSIHGHDAFLIEWDTLGPILTRALQLKAS
jgi:homoserine O-acetyltransferase